MTELEFSKTIILRKYPLRMTILIIIGLIGSGLELIGVGAVVPLLGSFWNTEEQISGKFGDFIEFIGKEPFKIR